MDTSALPFSAEGTGILLFSTEGTGPPQPLFPLPTRRRKRRALAPPISRDPTVRFMDAWLIPNNRPLAITSAEPPPPPVEPLAIASAEPPQPPLVEPSSLPVTMEDDAHHVHSSSSVDDHSSSHSSSSVDAHSSSHSSSSVDAHYEPDMPEVIQSSLSLDTPRNQRHLRRVARLEGKEPVSSRKRKAVDLPIVCCPLSLEVIPPHQIKRLRVLGRSRAYDITYLLPAIEADPLLRDPLTREPYSTHQLTSIRRAATAAGIRVTSSPVLKAIHGLRARQNVLVSILAYYEWTDIQNKLDEAVSTMEWWAKSSWFSDALRCEIVDRWMAGEERRCGDVMQGRVQLLELVPALGTGEEGSFDTEVQQFFNQDNFELLSREVMMERIPFDE